ncbi:GyrI-like domain-containing protein [Brevibacterium sp.]|uniref:AraC family transcriptional regulator n=1 Tax=Brevibacterium sp. TaxID=1701 RepID=UPI00264766C8|nr:GyrI-like domain-containing protein [Brevibacterium sp.]MDN6603091.1 GyrI-like domain-containing protein [Brevibacterium sp.]
MIAELNTLIDLIETDLSESTHSTGCEDDPGVDVEELAGRLGTTEYHLRRMFSSLAGMPLSVYIRRRRMTVAAADVVAGHELLGIAIRFGYGSTEAFGRAFRAVHGAGPSEVRRSGGPLRSQSTIRFRLTIEGSSSMDTRITDKPPFSLIGHAKRVPLLHEGENPHIRDHIESLPAVEHSRLKALSEAEPTGLLQVTADVDPDNREDTELTYLHGVAVRSAASAPEDLDVIDVDAGTWAVFMTSGSYPATLQSTWAATASEWFPSNPWRLRSGPSIVAILDRAEDFSTATTELWLPVERA